MIMVTNSFTKHTIENKNKFCRLFIISTVSHSENDTGKQFEMTRSAQTTHLWWTFFAEART